MARNPTVKQPSESGATFSPKSSFIENAEYNSEKETLTLTFKSGSQYAYQNVSPSTWKSFQLAPDHSSYYARNLKGQVSSSPIKQAVVGLRKSNPLKKITHERNLHAPDGNVELHGIKRIVKLAGLGTIPESLRN